MDHAATPGPDRLGRVARSTAALGVTVVPMAAVAGLDRLRWLTAELRAEAGDGGVTLDEAVGLAAAIGCWLCLLWVVLAFAATLAARLPGSVGRISDDVAGWIAPAAVRRLVAVALGATLVGGPAMAAAATTGRPPPQTVPVATATGWTAVRPAYDPPLLDRPSVIAETVVVAPGDSLWAIAARALGPDATDAAIAGAWPRWYEANRPVIGDDPDVIHPGQRLVPPAQ